MNPMQQREVLLDAGFRVAERVPLAQASIHLLVQEAQLPASDFMQLFGDLDDFLHGLQHQLAEDTREAVLSAMNAAPTNADRVAAGAKAYLESGLRQRGAFGWILDGCRKSEGLADCARKQNQSLAQVFAAGFAAAGSQKPLPMARLLLAALLETARAEQACGHALPELRAAAAKIFKASPGLALAERVVESPDDTRGMS